jgi:hypothetical protein
MPNHYDTDVYCKHCGKYIFSYLYDHEDDGTRFCSKKCEQENAISLKIVGKTERTTSGWEELLGHGCKSDSEMIEYAAHFSGQAFCPELKAVPKNFDCGDWIGSSW